MRKSVAETLIYLHLPKTAGQTLKSILYRYYSPSERFFFEGHQTVPAFAALSESERVRLRLVSGHMLYGVHTFLSQSYEYMAVLRNPLERVISYYYYVKRTPEHQHYKEVMTRELSLEEFVTGGLTVEMKNDQTRRLAGFHGHDVPFGACTQELLDQAKQNLESISLIGVSDRFDEFLVVLGKHFGWKRLYYESKNVTPRRPLAGQLSATTIDAIIDLNHLDLELYSHASKRVDQDMEKIAFPTIRIAVNDRVSQLYNRTIATYRARRTAAH